MARRTGIAAMMYGRDTTAFATPIGRVEVTGDEEQLYAIRIGPRQGTTRAASGGAVRRAREQIEAWFAGERIAFDLALAPAATARGAALRDGIVAVGYGETASYGALARLLASSPRAVGQACARNPFPLVVPCHRVLASGQLGAYSAGDGPITKQWLLDHERRYKERA